VIKRGLICFAVITLACVVVLSGEAHARGDYVSKRQLRETIANVRAGETSTLRTAAAERLFQLTRGKDLDKVDNKSITDLVSILDGSDDSVRYWVARCLGNFGSRARIAIPKLEELLAEVDCLPGSKTSASGIRLALSQIGTTPPPPNCQR
jgi:hypothetical protein